MLNVGIDIEPAFAWLFWVEWDTLERRLEALGQVQPNRNSKLHQDTCQKQACFLKRLLPCLGLWYIVCSVADGADNNVDARADASYRG